MTFGPLVEVSWLLAHLGEPGLVLVDCRWTLGDPSAGARAYRECHIPGATFLDLDRDLSGPAGMAGRHPLPSAAGFAAAARRAGISSDSRVVAYDGTGAGGAAPRLWWLLRHFGHAEAAVLDGGLAAWRAADGPLRSGVEEAEPGDFHAVAGVRAAAHDELLARLGDLSLVLLDARAPERFRGDHEPVDARAGHIPGARNLPVTELVRDGRMLPPEELGERLRGAGVEPGRQVVTYCGSGVTACSVALAAEAAGVRGVRLYPGSWSEWIARELAVETGIGEVRRDASVLFGPPG